MKNRHTDFLVIGSGVAGLMFALRTAAAGRVLIITKDNMEESATSYAQGGIAAAVGKMDLPLNHFEDTLKAGAGLCDPEAVSVLVNEGIERVKELIAMGMPFSLEQDGELHLGREGGHQLNRIVHDQDHTGLSLSRFLLQQVRKNTNIEILEHHCAIDLITEHHFSKSAANPPNCFGAYVLKEKTGEIIPIIASYTCLASGGAGQVYPFTTNPGVCTGDGIAMAYRAGCPIRNLEFIQFHPTALFHMQTGSERAFLITEAMRGEGGLLRNESGELFMKQYDPAAELAPRDIVARAIDSELKKSGALHVNLDARHFSEEKIQSHFPLIDSTLREKFRIDMRTEMIPVVPAAHYLCGGVLVDLKSATPLNFLYAVGEVSSTGVHGGNRLASNSLLEGLVFSHRAADDALESFADSRHAVKAAAADKVPYWDSTRVENTREWITIRHDRDALKSIMWDYVGIVRTRERLAIALKRIDVIYESVLDFYNRTIPTRQLLELRNQSLVSQLIVRSALQRKESRGLHWLQDTEEKRDLSRNDTILLAAFIRESAGTKKQIIPG